MAGTDAEAVARLTWTAFEDLDARMGEPAPVRTDDATRVRTGVVRVQAAVEGDPEGCWVVEDAEGLAGAAIALRRGGLWVLSLLVVRPGSQGQGLGGRLLTAALRTAAGARAGLIFSSRDPRALRRYQRAGFALHPALRAEGPLDRALLPAGLAVREGDPDRDAELCESVATRVRGVGHDRDVATLAAMGGQLLVVDEPGGARGFAVTRAGAVALCAATDEAVAGRLLWAGLAEAETPAGGAASAAWLTSSQGWAVNIVLDARLPLLAGPSVCTRGALGPMAPYLPSGLFG